MQNKITTLVLFVILMLPTSSYSMPDAIFQIGLGTGIFVVITILVIIIYVISEIRSKKDIKDKS